MRKVIVLLICMLVISCKKESVVDMVTVNTCDFNSDVTVENETPLPVYSTTLVFSECEESIALFRENLNYSGELKVSLNDDTTNVSITFTNSVGQANYPDQGFRIIGTTTNPAGQEIFIFLGTGVINSGVARITSYAPPEADSYFRLFNDSGWLSPYDSNTDRFCTDGTTGVSEVVPPLQQTRIDNDSGWGSDVELSYVFDPITGQYEACVSGVADYTIEWNINGALYYGDTIETIVGKAEGIYFIAATIFYNSERITLSHNVVKTTAGKGAVRRARIRRPSGN